MKMIEIGQEKKKEIISVETETMNWNDERRHSETT